MRDGPYEFRSPCFNALPKPGKWGMIPVTTRPDIREGEEAMGTTTAYAIEQTMRLLAIDSPTGYTRNVTDYLLKTLKDMGFQPERTRKGCVLCPLGGAGRPLVLAAHVDTLGLMVRGVKENGRLTFTLLGGPSCQAIETENVTVMTRDGRRYTGVVQLMNASKHVNAELETAKRDADTMEILLDEEVSAREDVRALGIETGDVVFLDPRSRVTPSGFIRSRFLDDKLSAGMLLALARDVADGRVRLARRVSLFFTVYEETGHGASSGVPLDTEELLVVDMGCVGEGLGCKEQQVSVCAKDSAGPYDYGMTGDLIALCRREGIDYAVDVYPFYGSDAAAALRAGYDLRFALIGAGVYASHGYERSHLKGVENTLRLLAAYVGLGEDAVPPSGRAEQKETGKGREH